MTQFRFKTSIMCNGCIEKVGPELNAIQGIKKWDVDISHPDKILTVDFNGNSEAELIHSVKKAGFEITLI